MTISTQQINSVLRTYNKQLKFTALNRNKKNILPQSKNDDVTISAEGKRQQIYQQAVSNVVNELTKKDQLSTVFFK